MSDFSVFQFKPAPWMQQANCRGVDPNVFFPDVGESGERAKAICNGTTGKKLRDGTVVQPNPPCPVREECLQYAIDHPGRTAGVWGGLAERERRNVAVYGQTRKPYQPREKKVEVSTKKSLMPHGSVARYELEIAVKGEACEACTLAKWRQDNARQDHPELAEALRLISEVHEASEK